MKVEWINQEICLPLSEDIVNELVSIAEHMGRICYRSESKGDPIEFLSRIISSGHESVIEHISIPAVFVTDRAVTHQLVRHRHLSISQESQRYVNYDKEGIIRLVKPQFFGDPESPVSMIDSFKRVSECLANSYAKAIANGIPPEEARSILPNCTATRIGVTANLREWRHIFRIRLHGSAQPQIRALLLGLRSQMEVKYGLEWAFKDLPRDLNRIYIKPNA